MGVPLDEVRGRNRERLAAAFSGFESDLIGVLSKLPYDDVDLWLDLCSTGDAGIVSILKPAYEASMVFLRRQIAELGLSYPEDPVDGLAPESHQRGDVHAGVGPDDTLIDLDNSYTQVSPEAVSRCCVVLRFIGFASMKTRETGRSMLLTATRAWIANAFLRVTDPALACSAMRVMLDLVVNDGYIPPYSTLDVVLSSALLVPCGSSSSPETARQSLIQFVESDELAADVVSQKANSFDSHSLGRLVGGPKANDVVAQLRLSRATEGPSTRVALIELQIYSLCTLFALTFSSGFDELVSRRAPSALAAVADLIRAPDNDLFTPLKIAVAETLWCVLGFPGDDDWPEVYALRLGITAQLAAIKDASSDTGYLRRLLSAVAYGVESTSSFLPKILHIATDDATPGELRVSACAVIHSILRDKDLSAGVLRAQNAYALLVGELSRSAAAVASAATDKEAQIADALATGYVNLFRDWIQNARTPELEHALINSEFFDACADLAEPRLMPFVRKRTYFLAIHIASLMLDHSRIEPLVERGVVERFIAALHGFIDAGLSSLFEVDFMASRLWHGGADAAYEDLVKHAFVRVLSSPWEWDTSLRQYFRFLIGRSNNEHEYRRILFSESLKLALAPAEELPSKAKRERDFQVNATHFAFELVMDRPTLEPDMIGKLFVAAQRANVRPQTLQFYGAQNLDGCVTKFLEDSAQTPNKASFLLAVDKVSLSAERFCEGESAPSRIFSYEEYMPMILDSMTMGSVAAAYDKESSTYSEAVLFAFNKSDFFSDKFRIQLVLNIMRDAEQRYSVQPGSGNIRQLLLFLRHITADWKPIGPEAATVYNETVMLACHILGKAFEYKDEPTRTLTFSVLGHVAGRSQDVSLSEAAKKEVESVLTAALNSEKLQARSVIPPWFGKLDPGGGVIPRWKKMFAEVAHSDPGAVLRLVSSFSDRDFSRHIDGFIAAGDVAVTELRQGQMGQYLELVASIADRLRFPWVPFERMFWHGAQVGTSLVMDQFRGAEPGTDLAASFGPLSALVQHTLCLTLVDSHERGLSAEEQLSSIRRSPLDFVEGDSVKIMDAMKSALEHLLAHKVPSSCKTDETARSTISGIAWILVRFIDWSPRAAKYAIDSGLYALLVQCTNSDFRQRDGSPEPESEDNKKGTATEEADFSGRGSLLTADSAVADVAEQSLRAVTHAISTAGVAGERKVAMLLDTPRVVGFNQIQHIDDVKYLLLRRPELRHVALEHIIRTSRGLAPASDAPDSQLEIAPLDAISRDNIDSMIVTLVPAFLGEDLRMSEVTGDSLVDLLSSVGAARDVLLDRYPDIIMTVIRKFGPRHAPDDPRLGGRASDAHILETSIRFLSTLAVQGLDDPFTVSVRDSLIKSTESLFNGAMEVMRSDVMAHMTAGRHEEAAFILFFIASVLLRAATMQNRLELPVWSRLDADDNVPPFVKALRTSHIVTGFLEVYAHLDPSALVTRMFRDEAVGVLEEYTIFEGCDWPYKIGAVAGQDDESDDNEQPNEATRSQRHRQRDEMAVDRDVFRNSVLGDIDDENVDEEEYMDYEDDDMESLEGELGSDEFGDESSHESSEYMSYDESDEGSSDDGDLADTMSIVQYASGNEDSSSSDEDAYLMGNSGGEEESDPADTPEVIETVFTSEDYGQSGDGSAGQTSDSELDDFEPESSDADTQMPSDVDIVLEGVQPVTGFDLMSGILLRFGNELEMLDEPDIDVEEDSETEEVEPYAHIALFSTGIPAGSKEQPVLAENNGFLAWWNESTLESSEVLSQIDYYLETNALELRGPANDATVAAVRSRQKSPGPPPRAFGSKRFLATEKIAASLVRMLYSTLFEQDRMDISEMVFQLLHYREGRDVIVDFLMTTLFEASDGNVTSSYAKMCSILQVPAIVPCEATPALVCANCLRLLCDVYDAEIDAPARERLENDPYGYERLRRRLSRALLRNFGPRLIELLGMSQICQDRKLLHNAASMVLNVLSITGTRRFDSSAETLAQLAKVLGLRECTSESFSALTEIVQKHLRTDALLPNVIRETRRARSSLLVLLPAVAKPDATGDTVDAFATEQVKLLRLMSLLNRVYEPQQVLAALKSVNLLPLWHSVGTRLHNGTLDGPTNGRGFASGVSLLESFALALSAAVKWKSPVPDTHPALTKYAQWIRSYLRSFMGQRKALINELLRARPNLYLGPMGDMARTLNLFDFQSKQTWLRSKVAEDEEQVHSEVRGDLRFSVRRKHVLEDTFTALHGLKGPILRAPLYVMFEREEAVDAGGVSREWLELIAREIFNPAYALFTPTQEGSSVYQVNRDSGVNPNHLDYFLVVGRVLARAIYDGRMVGLYFSRIVYKYLLGRPNVTLADMEAVDEQYYRSLVWMLEMDVTGVIEETFSVEGEQFGQPFVVDLVENGRNIPVTEENKQEYVKRIVEYKLVDSVKDQLAALRRGFNDVIKPELVEPFDEQELELLLCGLPTIRVDDWRANTTYVGYNAQSPQIRWFWTAVASFSTEERAKLLQFSTGTSRVPVLGFAHLESSSAGSQFQIHKEHGSTNRWPSSHTCMNQINLPAYESYKKLRTMLLRAIVEGAEGFGFV